MSSPHCHLPPKSLHKSSLSGKRTCPPSFQSTDVRPVQVYEALLSISHKQVSWLCSCCIGDPRCLSQEPKQVQLVAGHCDTVIRTNKTLCPISSAALTPSIGIDSLISFAFCWCLAELNILIGVGIPKTVVVPVVVFVDIIFVQVFFPEPILCGGFSVCNECTQIMLLLKETLIFCTRLPLLLPLTNLRASTNRRTALHAVSIPFFSNAPLSSLSICSRPFSTRKLTTCRAVTRSLFALFCRIKYKEVRQKSVFNGQRNSHFFCCSVARLQPTPCCTIHHPLSRVLRDVGCYNLAVL